MTNDKESGSVAKKVKSINDEKEPEFGEKPEKRNDHNSLRRLSNDSVVALLSR